MHQPFATDWLIVRPIEEIELPMGFAAFLDHTDDPNSLPNAGSHNTFYFRALTRGRFSERVGGCGRRSGLRAPRRPSSRLSAGFACR